MMTVQKWEHTVRVNGCVPVSKFTVGKCEVFVAEGMRMARVGSGRVTSKPHYRVFWAIRARIHGHGTFDNAEMMDIEAWAHPSRAERDAIVRRDAEKWIKANRQFGRYDA